VSRQVSALEAELKVPLFHRHARGLVLTEQGELLFRTAHEVFMKLEATRAKLGDSHEKPSGELRVTTAIGLGSYWLSPRIGEFLDLYPEMRVQLILSDEELDLAMREADASPAYLKNHGHPREVAELDRHRILILGGQVPSFYLGLNWLREAGRPEGKPRDAAFSVNNVMGLKQAVENGAGIATLPDYLAEEAGLVLLFPEHDAPKLDAYFVYPEELRSVARVQVFRDFLISKAQRWQY
jgi:DNA-binding transcriptional LysR family regulator